jgi:hypothetical protein
MPKMTRIRTKKTKFYFIVSNATAQDCTLSFEALGLLTYCLSMSEEWEFKPKLIAKSRGCSRDKAYKLFNELIQSFHCIRIKIPNPKAKGLPGEVEYEIFCDVEDCKARIKELETQPVFLEHGDNFKKCFRRPCFPDTDSPDPENTDVINKQAKESKILREQTKQEPHEKQPVVVVFSEDEKEKRLLLEKYNLPEASIEFYLNISLQQLRDSLLAYDQYAKDRVLDNPKGAIRQAIIGAWKPNLTKEDKVNHKQHEKEERSLIAEENKRISKQLRAGLEHKFEYKDFKMVKGFEISDSMIHLYYPSGRFPLPYEEVEFRALLEYYISNILS